MNIEDNVITVKSSICTVGESVDDINFTATEVPILLRVDSTDTGVQPIVKILDQDFAMSEIQNLLDVMQSLQALGERMGLIE